MSEIKAATPSPIAASPRANASVHAARPRKESRGWLALILQVLGFAGAGAAGFAASHYFTLQQQAAAERQKVTAEAKASTAAATQATPPAAPASVDQPAEEPATEEASAPEQRFSEEVERAQMIEGGQVAPLNEVENSELKIDSTKGLPFDKLEPAPSDLKVETLDGQPVENPDEPGTP